MFTIQSNVKYTIYIPFQGPDTLVSSKRSNNLDIQCSEYVDCDNMITRSCYCDTRCRFFGDCCPRIPLGRTQGTIDTYQDQGMPPRKMFSCEEYPGFVEYYFGMYVIASCPDRNTTCFNTTNVYSMENILHVTDKKNVTYRNAACARCNGISTYSYWDTSFSMQGTSQCIGQDMWPIDIGETVNLDTETDARVLLEQGCTMETYPPIGKSLRFCMRAVKEIDNCSATFNPVRDNTNVFLNTDCCRKELGTCTTRVATCLQWKVDEFYTTPWDVKDGKYLLWPTTVLFRVSEVCINLMHKYSKDVISKIDCWSSVSNF